MKILGIQFAPLCIPLERRLQTLAAAAWIYFILLGATVSWIFFIWSLIYSPILRIPLILYYAYIHFDKHVIDTDTRRSHWVRNWSWWKYFANFFPVQLVKTTDLPPSKSYIFATFPHGVLSVGVFCSFSCDACEFQKVFPNITPHTATLAMHFTTPFIRELGLALGSIPATEKNIMTRLSTPGRALALVVGGAEEAFHSKPGQYNIIVNRRKGFIRVALKSGASIVPTIAFGEPDVFDQIQCAQGTFLRWTQDFYKKLTGIAPVYLVGRGIFQYTYGLVPFREPVFIVAGAPIHVNKVENPEKSEIDDLHAIFCEKLKELFENNKEKYTKQKKCELVFL